MDAKLAKIYCSPQGYWKSVSAIKKLAEAAKVPENVVQAVAIQAGHLARSIFLRLDMFLARNLMWRLPTRSTRQTFFFYLMTSSLVEERFTNMR